jgi:hypothetical protein
MATRRSGFVTLVGVLFLFAALFNIVVGILALASPDYHTGDPPFGSLETLGIVLLILGGLQLIAAIGIMTRRAGARILGIVLAILGAAWTVLFERTNPSWALTILIVDAIIVYLLVVHGDEFAY